MRRSKNSFVLASAFGLIVIGYIFFAMNTDRILVSKKARLENQIQQGSGIYQENCSDCHGINGKSEQCFDQLGQPIACQGAVLKRWELFCGEKSLRMDELAWRGSFENFIYSSIANGRYQTNLHAYGKELGGELSINEIEQITAYLLGFKPQVKEQVRYISLPLRDNVPSRFYWPASISELPLGNAEFGKEKYEITYGCYACHGDPQVTGSNVVGPWAGNFKNVRLKRGNIEYTAADYFYESVLLPSKFIAPKCPTGDCSGPPSGMPDNFGLRMTHQDLADVMAYLEIDHSETFNVQVVYPPATEGYENFPEEYDQYIRGC
ncbi:MAG: c-type cytochrome [Chloroflexota bacterium]